MVKIVKQTRQVFVHDPFCTDIILKANTKSTALATEDYPIQVNGLSREQMMFQGLSNSLHGTEAWADSKAKVRPKKTPRGVNSETHAQKIRDFDINLKEE